jgi:hypothetical protein
MVNNSIALMFHQSVLLIPNNIIFSLNQQTNPTPQCMDEATF